MYLKYWTSRFNTKVKYLPEVNFRLHIHTQPDNSKMLDYLFQITATI